MQVALSISFLPGCAAAVSMAHRPGKLPQKLSIKPCDRAIATLHQDNLIRIGYLSVVILSDLGAMNSSVRRQLSRSRRCEQGCHILLDKFAQGPGLREIFTHKMEDLNYSIAHLLYGHVLLCFSLWVETCEGRPTSRGNFPKHIQQNIVNKGMRNTVLHTLWGGNL